MGIFDRFRSDSDSDPVESAKTQYVKGEIDKTELESRLSRAVEIEQTEREKRRELQAGSPSSLIDTGGTVDSHQFTEQQELGTSELRELKRMRESGGVVSQLLHARALLAFGTGAEFQADDDSVAELLNEDLFPDIDNLAVNIGEDAYWFARSFGEIVETTKGDFSHLELVEPWTMVPEVDQHGEVLFWEQETKDKMQQKPTFDPDEIASFILSKSSGRDKTGISVAWRAKDEIEQFMENKRSIRNAIEIAGFPHVHWKVGRDDAAIIDDNELKRVRNKVQRLDSDSHIITGTDVKADQIEPTTFDFTEITKHDMRQVALALGVPLEVASVISEGLGSGEQSAVRQQMFERQARADQRRLAGQFIHQVVEPVLREYSEYNPENVDVDLRFGDPIQEDVSTTEFVQNNSENFTTNEIRGQVDFEPLDDPEEGESFDPPGESDGQDDPFGGMFEDAVDSALENRELEDGGMGNLNLDAYPEWERSLLELHQGVWGAESETRLLSFTESELPEFVLNRLRDAIFSDAFFSDFSGISSESRRQMQQFLAEELTESGGWTIDGLANRLQDIDEDISMDQARNIARTETAAIANTAREEGYREQGLLEGEDFYWTGNLDGRQTDACEWLIKKTNPHHGGEPVPMDELKDLIEEAPEHDPDLQDDIARPDDLVVHPQERKTAVRHVSA